MSTIMSRAEEYNDTVMEMMLFTLSMECETCSQANDWCGTCIDGAAAVAAVCTDLYMRGHAKLGLEVLHTYRPLEGMERMREVW